MGVQKWISIIKPISQMQKQFIWISKAISAAPNYQWQIGMRLSATLCYESLLRMIQQRWIKLLWMIIGKRGEGGYSLFAFLGGSVTLKSFNWWHRGTLLWKCIFCVLCSPLGCIRLSTTTVIPWFQIDQPCLWISIELFSGEKNTDVVHLWGI